MTNGEIKIVPKRACAVLDEEVTDRQLLGRFNASRDELGERAFALLVGRHGPMVLRVCHQILGDRDGAEDAFQATFLVLARKSGSIRQPELLANWLYGVALRTAWEAKMREGQRRRREVPTADSNPGEPTGDADRPELALIGREEYQVLHEEVSRLPERYRLPVVLCELEGLSYQEAARRLRCPVGTIGVRLSRARERLRVRMIQRGIVPTAAIATALLGADDAAARLSAELVDATARAAVGFAAGEAAVTGLVSSAVLGLTQAVLRLMAMARFQLATHVIFTVAVTATLFGIAVHRHRQLPVVSLAESTPSQDGSAGSPDVAFSPALPGTVPVRPQGEVQRVDPQPGKPAIMANTEAPRPETMPEPKPKPVVSAAKSRVRAEQARGEMLFVKEWAPDDPMSPGGDGLGPVYNESSCVACHGLGSPGGAGPASKNVTIVTLAGRLARKELKSLGRIHPGLRDSPSTVLHRFGTDPQYASWRRTLFEARENPPAKDAKDPPEESAEERIRKIAQHTGPGNRLQDRGGLVHPATGIALRISERNTPALFGAGRIDAIPSEALIEEAAHQPEKTRGRVSRDRNGAVGRFGWKGQVASLHEFVRGACAGELGLEVPGHSQSASPLAPDAKPKGLDMSEGECDDLVAYVRGLPAPVVIDPKGPQGTTGSWEGRRLMEEVGCTACHAPSLGSVRGLYSDLLLHDMGPSLSDAGTSYGIEGPFSPGDPSPGEWRTPPLWGFRDSGPYLHDGRAETLEEAVALHGGQAANSARAFFGLSPLDRYRVESFLKSLVAPAAAAAPGVILAAELESRIVPDSERAAEAQVRKERQKVAAREEKARREAERRKLAEFALLRAQRQLPIAVNLERSGKIAGALEFYRTIAREAPQTEEGRTAAERIEVLEPRIDSP